MEALEIEGQTDQTPLAGGGVHAAQRELPKAEHLGVDPVPGLRLTLDYSHVLAQGYPPDAVHPLLPLAGHFHALWWLPSPSGPLSCGSWSAICSRGDRATHVPLYRHARQMQGGHDMVMTILGTIKRRADPVLWRAHRWLLAHTKPATGTLVRGAVADAARSKAALLAENALLRRLRQDSKSVVVGSHLVGYPSPFIAVH